MNDNAEYFKTLLKSENFILEALGTVAVVVISIAVTVARLFQDKQDPSIKITRRDWITYGSVNLVACFGTWLLLTGYGFTPKAALGWCLIVGYNAVYALGLFIYFGTQILGKRFGLKSSPPDNKKDA